MPITLQHEFEQSSEYVIVHVSIRGVSRQNITVEISSCYIKLNSSPHFFDADLFVKIDPDKSSWQFNPVRPHTVTFKLKKLEDIEWEELTLKPGETFTKKQIIDRRNASLLAHQEKERKLRQERLMEKKKQEKELMEKQWELDRIRRQEIEEKKNKEKEEAEKELVNWQTKLEQQSVKGEPVENTSNKSEKLETEIWEPSEVNEIPNETIVQSEVEKLEPEERDLPVVRLGGTFKLKFTPRTINTPAREDKDVQMLKKYEVWKKHNKDRKIDNEENPVWIKVRGDKFYSRGNYIAAINAYDACLQKLGTIVPKDVFEIRVFSNRAICHLNLHNYSQCIKDCCTVLGTEALPDVSNVDKELANFWKKSLVRRGTARWRCGEIESAIKDYEFAISKFSGDDEDLIHDLETMKNELGANDKQLDQVTELKVRADEMLHRKSYGDAAGVYTSIIQMLQHLTFNINTLSDKIVVLLSCYSNRAMCHLELTKFGLCISDCDSILDFFEKSGDKLPEMLNTKRYVLQLKAYTRRGMAYCSLGDYRKAYDDYERASRMAPHDEAILADMSQISQKLTSQIEAEWLKNRGNYFFKLGDNESAIHCYTLATQQDKSNPVYYSNRAQCYLNLNQYIACIEDCNTALSILPEDKLEEYQRRLEHPELYENEERSEMDFIPTNEQLTESLQLKLFYRRACAYEHCEEWISAYSDMKRVCQLVPTNAEHQQKLKELQEKLPPQPVEPIEATDGAETSSSSENLTSE